MGSPHLAVVGTDADCRHSVENVDSSLIFLLSRGPDGHVCQLVPIHISQHCHSCPKAAPGMALLTTENGLTAPMCPLLKRNRVRPKTLATFYLTPSPIGPRLTPFGKGHTDT